MQVVIAYGTIEGQTRRIARAMSATVQRAGSMVTVYDMDDLDDIDLAAANRVIIAAPVHAGEYPDEITDWVAAHAGKLNAMPSAFVSVSLSAASAIPDEQEAVEKITADFLAKSGWHPGLVHHAAGALRYTEYDFFKRMLMRYIARKEGGDVDTSRDHEYTDWQKLSDFVTEFMKTG